MRELQPRVDRIAAAARPAEGLTLSLCMIVKDEEAMIGRCLEAARDAVDEIVVVDTGSTDRTVEIAERHRRPRPAPRVGRRLLRRAQRRPSTPPPATGSCTSTPTRCSWPTTPQRLRALTGRTWREAFFLTETNHTGDLEDGTAITHDAMRVFRNRPEYRFEGRIHEQIAQHLPAYLPERQERTTVRVEHFGYLGAVRDTKDKTNRNLELLERQVAEGVDNPFLHFNLGSEYAATGDAPRALTHFAARLERPCAQTGRVSSDGYAPGAGRALRRTRCATPAALADVAAAGDEALEIFPGFTDIVLEQALAAGAAGDLEREEALLRRCLEMGDGPSRYSATVGCGHLSPARGAGRRPAPPRRPGGGRGDAARLPAASTPASWPPSTPTPPLLLRRGVPAAEVVETVHALVADSTPERALPARRRALARPAPSPRPRAELRAVLEAQPANAHARVALAETLLAQGRFADAAASRRRGRPRGALRRRRPAHRALRPPDRRHARPTPQSRAGPARRGARRLRRLAGRALRRRTRRPRCPPRPPRPMLIMLDALARLQAFDAFEDLVAVLEAVAIPWRERREALAELYLRHGYADSAAEEWIAVCERERRRRAGAARPGRRGRRPRASTRTPRCSPPRPTRWPRPDPAQVLVAPAESSDDKLGHGRPGSAFPRRN